MTEKGKMQKLIEAGLCPKCESAVDYSKDIAICNVCGLQISNAKTVNQPSPSCDPPNA